MYVHVGVSFGTRIHYRLQLARATATSLFVFAPAMDSAVISYGALPSSNAPVDGILPWSNVPSQSVSGALAGAAPTELRHEGKSGFAEVTYKLEFQQAESGNVLPAPRIYPAQLIFTHQKKDHVLFGTTLTGLNQILDGDFWKNYGDPDAYVDPSFPKPSVRNAQRYCMTKGEFNKKMEITKDILNLYSLNGIEHFIAQPYSPIERASDVFAHWNVAGFLEDTEPAHTLGNYRTLCKKRGLVQDGMSVWNSLAGSGASLYFVVAFLPSQTASAYVFHGYEDAAKGYKELDDFVKGGSGFSAEVKQAAEDLRAVLFKKDGDTWAWKDDNLKGLKFMFGDPLVPVVIPVCTQGHPRRITYSQGATFSDIFEPYKRHVKDNEKLMTKLKDAGKTKTYGILSALNERLLAKSNAQVYYAGNYVNDGGYEFIDEGDEIAYAWRSNGYSVKSSAVKEFTTHTGIRRPHGAWTEPTGDRLPNSATDKLMRTINLSALKRV